MMLLQEKYVNPFTDSGFKKIFGTEPNKDEVAEIAKFTPVEREQYEESLKSYRDLKNVIDTSFGEGKIEGKIEEKTEIITMLILQGILTDEQIASASKTTPDVVRQIRQEIAKMP